MSQAEGSPWATAPVLRAPDPQSKFLEKCFSGFAWRRSWGAQWEVRGRGIGAGGVPMFSNSSAIASCQPPFCCPACKPNSSEAACERTEPPGRRFSRTLSGGLRFPPRLVFTCRLTSSPGICQPSQSVLCQHPSRSPEDELKARFAPCLETEVLLPRLFSVFTL